jgi:hypothetical protein
MTSWVGDLYSFVARNDGFLRRIRLVIGLIDFEVISLPGKCVLNLMLPGIAVFFWQS